MDISNEYIANKKDLSFYAGKAILNRRHAFTDIDGNAWDFGSATGFTWKIWEEREGGRLMISWTSPHRVSASGNELILNATAEETNIERGRYYYEIEYLVAGGYAVLIAFGEAKFI